MKSYNDLVCRRVSSDATACILILKVLPSDSSQWLVTAPEGLFMGGACYWKYIDGELSKNKTSVRIRIAKEQEFSPESLLRLMTCAREYSISGDWIC